MYYSSLLSKVLLNTFSSLKAQSGNLTVSRLCFHSSTQLKSDWAIVLRVPAAAITTRDPIAVTKTQCGADLLMLFLQNQTKPRRVCYVVC